MVRLCHPRIKYLGYGKSVVVLSTGVSYLRTGLQAKDRIRTNTQAMHIQPSDRAILYNIAMIQQKSAELLFSLEPSKRTTEELKVAIDHAQQAVK